MKIALITNTCSVRHAKDFSLYFERLLKYDTVVFLYEDLTTHHVLIISPQGKIGWILSINFLTLYYVYCNNKITCENLAHHK